MTINEAVKKLVQTYVKYPSRPLQSETYTGPITLSQYFRLKQVRERRSAPSPADGLAEATVDTTRAFWQTGPGRALNSNAIHRQTRIEKAKEAGQIP